MKIEIPKNAINGDILVTLYPNTVFRFDSTVRRIFADEEDVSVSFDWWSEPYKKDNKKSKTRDR